MTNEKDPNPKADDRKVGEKTPPTDKQHEAEAKEGKTFGGTGTEKKG